MKKVVYIISAVIIMLTNASCGNNQKPSDRSSVWGEDVDTTTVKGISLSSEKVFVPFQRTASGLAQVQVSLNGVPFNMWWDTGASITSISSLEFIKLVKEGRVEEDDKIGSIQAKYADGSSGEEDVYRIREISIQGKDNEHLTLYGVAVSVSENLGAPLLIGQNVISELPKHKFNDDTEEIEFDKE